MPRRYAIDVAEAEAKHRQLSRMLHPDKHVGGAAGERRMALSRAIEVNEAWRALRDPVQRAQTILGLEGLGDEIGETREPKPSAAFLMEVLEAREALDEAKTSKDGARVHAVVEDARRQHRSAEDALARAIDGALAGGGGKDRLRAAIPLLGALRYATRFLEEAISAEDALSGF
ncbi:MAG: hypothetical protein NVSMB47_08250 [Polyangiales bacterium]